MKRLSAVLLTLLLLTASVLTAPAAHAAIAWHLCYGAQVGSNCTTHAVASNRVPAWAVPNTSSYRLTFQSDCNLVFYDPGYANGVSWATNTYNIPRPCTLRWQGDGNVVIYDANNVARWASGTNYGTAYTYVMWMNDAGCLWIDRATTHVWVNHSYCTYS